MCSREVGGYDESLRRGEDWELNYRLRNAGHIVWLDPELRVSYWPRATWTKLARQFFATGVWRGELVRRLGGRNPLRFFAPPALLLATVLSIIAIPLHATGVLPAWAAWVVALVYLGPLAYLVLLVVAAITSSGSFADRAAFRARCSRRCTSAGALGFSLGVTRRRPRRGRHLAHRVASSDPTAALQQPRRRARRHEPSSKGVNRSRQASARLA